MKIGMPLITSKLLKLLYYKKPTNYKLMNLQIPDKHTDKHNNSPLRNETPHHPLYHLRFHLRSIFTC